VKGELLALAGLWDQWESPEGPIIESCSILTTAASSLVAHLHDRMPVIVPPDKYGVWLDPDVNDFNVIRDILRPYDANLMRRYPEQETQQFENLTMPSPPRPSSWTLLHMRRCFSFNCF
jgi:putative SOS response-associated peptidase YedK